VVAQFLIAIAIAIANVDALKRVLAIMGEFV
jgi:hypothetical protein